MALILFVLQWALQIEDGGNVVFLANEFDGNFHGESLRRTFALVVNAEHRFDMAAEWAVGSAAVQLEGAAGAGVGFIHPVVRAACKTKMCKQDSGSSPALSPCKCLTSIFVDELDEDWVPASSGAASTATMTPAATAAATGPSRTVMTAAATSAAPATLTEASVAASHVSANAQTFGSGFAEADDDGEEDRRQKQLHSDGIQVRRGETARASALRLWKARLGLQTLTTGWERWLVSFM